ncbi:MAG: hypothetical protein J5822_02130 [Eubacteriaceae bacterium]|nr:hypothetical protein [Eubacteriaceae bacterium]
MAGDFDRKKFDYDAAMAQLYDSGCRDPEEVYDTLTEKGLKSLLGDYGLKFEDFYDRPPRDRRGREQWEMEHEQEDSGSGSDEGCFLTSACVNARNLPDDCYELTVLRNFRDSYVRQLPGGEKETRHYYRTAPEIVRHIDSSDDASSRWESIYSELILPCVEDIGSGRFEQAYLRYRQYVLSLEEAFGIS